MIDVGAIRQENIGKRAPVLVLTVGLKRDFFSEYSVEGACLALLP